MPTTELFSFLSELKENNNKAWFDENRPRYEKLRGHFMELVQATIHELSSRMNLATIEPKNCVFRINRDVRFSKNKNPYKSNFAFAISPEGKNGMMPKGVYVHLEPGACFLGFGMYEPSPEQLKAIRQEIDYSFDRWTSITQAPEFTKTFGHVQGESLKTTPKGYDATNPAIESLKMKQFYISHNFSDAQSMQKDFPQYIGKVFDASQDFRQFLADAIVTG